MGICFPVQSLRTPIERIVSEHIGQHWAIGESKDMTEFACHPCAILSNGAFAVFVKFSDAENGLEQFEIELAGLQRLRTLSGILTPTPIAATPGPGGSLLILEAAQAVERRPHHWRQIGQTLARIHKIKGQRFGLETHGYFGPLPQDNTFADDWPTFYAERRLWPGLKLAVDSGRLPLELGRKIEKLIARLPALCGPNVVPALIHGDAQQNNFISTPSGAMVIDPATYYGNPEMDLAYIDYFQAVPEDVLDGYREELPIDPGFWERRGLWRVWGYLAAVTVEGCGYVGRLSEAVQRYVS